MLLDVLAQKCAYKGIPIPSLAALEPHRTTLESTWASMLAHQLPAIPPVGEFWAALPEIFRWIAGAEAKPRLTGIAPDGSGTPVHDRVLPVAIPYHSRGPLEIIRFAAANRLCVDLTYDGTIRRIEPYSLRQSAAGDFLLHAIRNDSGSHRSYRADRIQAASVTAQSFAPRYIVELSATGPVPYAGAVPRSASTGGPARRVGSQESLPRTPVRPRNGPIHVYRCAGCGKIFRRKSMNSALKAHKTPSGYDCPNRAGVYEKTEY